MEVATGAMRSLIPKLGRLLLNEYNLKETVKKGIRELKAELETMQAALEKVSNVPLDQLDSQVKIWANQVRELSFAIEDSLDSSMVRIEGLEQTSPDTFNFKGFIKKTRNKVSKFKIHHKLANDIKDVKIQVTEVKERYERYKVSDVVANAATTTVDPRLLAIYNKVSDLVGIDKAIDELTQRLSDDDDPGKKLNAVAVVGFGGLGKTTLAKAVYDKLNKKFDCGGFVPVGQNPDMKKVLRDILLELDIELYRDAATMDERQLINQLQKFLVGKRYFIVIDDIWDVPTWEMIKCALVDSNSESRIIITTRNVEVAQKVGCIYNMKPLSDDDSKCLFYTRTCGAEGVSSDNQPAEVTDKILKKCGGVPLAIITIASLLVGKQSDDWSKVYDAIGFGHEDNFAIHNTRKILSFSYYELPSNLKTCLLYLSMFPEDSFIEKKTLIWRWVYEGFVPHKDGIGSFELGEIYFNELVNKSMIRWIEPDEFMETPGGCRVHDMVLELIRTISNDVNFVTVHDMEQHGTCSRGKQANMVRRLALHGRSVEHNSGIEMERVRSFNSIACSDSRMPLLLLSFKVLRVLVIQDCVFPEGSSLDHLGKLVQLRYLGLVHTSVKLPEGVGHDLKFLEILDVRGGLITELPPSVGELKNLRCLWTDDCTEMNGEIGKLTCLEELQLHSVNKCPNFCTQLGKLTKLRVLEIYFDEMEVTMGKALAKSLCNLPKIQSLAVWHTDVYSHVLGLCSLYPAVLGGSLEDLAPSSKLHLLTLPSIIIPSMPSWINSLCVPLLSHICLLVEELEARDLQTLGRLPSLLYLILQIEEKRCISYTFGSDEFHKLRWLIVNKVEMSIGEGALPMLERLSYSASAQRMDLASLVPWNNSCPLLEEVTCIIDCANSGCSEVEAVEDALEYAVMTHPNRPTFRKRRENYDEDIYGLESFLCHLDSIDVVALIGIYEERIRDTITTLETLLRDAAQPRVGRYDEQDMRYFVTTLASWIHASTDQEVPDNGSDHASCSRSHQERWSQP